MFSVVCTHAHFVCFVLTPPMLLRCLHLMLAVYVCISPYHMPFSPCAVRAGPAAVLFSAAICRIVDTLGSTAQLRHPALRSSTQTTNTYLAPVTSLYALCLHGTPPLPVPCWSMLKLPHTS
ncbi:hypothetical protein ABBQ38_004526 [Trebouxia sp. C0009 RCD-2024]